MKLAPILRAGFSGVALVAIVALAGMVMSSAHAMKPASEPGDALGWLTPLPLQFIARREGHNGLPQDIYRFVVPSPPASVFAQIQEAARALPDAGEVINRSAHGWQVLSVWQRRQLLTVQVRATDVFSTEGLVTATDFRTVSAADSAGAGPSVSVPRAPGWWPRLERPWLQGWNDNGASVMSMLGWFSGSTANAEREMARAIKVAGLTLVSRADVPGKPGGIVLVYAGPRAELLVTLSAQGIKTGVVAHYTERLQ